jgi:hypothetical protein
MLKIFSTCLRGVLLTLGIAVAQSCSQQKPELPAPLATPAATGVSVAEARNWYQTAYPGRLTGLDKPSAASSPTARATSATTAQLVWQRAFTVGTGARQLVLVPFAGDAALFTHSSFAGPRYLLVSKQTTTVLDGKIIELLLPRTSQPIDTLALVTSLYHSYQSGHLAAPDQGNGFVFLYSADYQYLTGRQFQKGQFLPGTAWLAFQAVAGSTTSAKTTQQSGYIGGPTANAVPVNSGCTDWYDGQTGTYITSTGDCREGDPPVLIYPGGGGPGGPAPTGNGPGGHGGGGGVGVVAQQV